MTVLDPGYGRTALAFEELDALLPEARATLPSRPSRADVFDLELVFEVDVRHQLTGAVLDGSLTLDDLLGDGYVRDLHRWLYGPIWTWAGRVRRLETSIGVALEHVMVELRAGLENLRHRWELRAWTPRQLGVAVQAEVVRVHPFTDGNGRATRLLADLVHLAAQPVDDTIAVFDWDASHKRAYIAALRRYDSHRDPVELADLVGTRSIAG